MLRPWPEGGAWFVAPTSASVDWRMALAALSATARVRVATVVLLGPGDRLGEPVDAAGGPASGDFGTGAEQHGGRALERVDVDTRIEVRDGSGKDVLALLHTLRSTHGLVLVAAPRGLQTPLDERGRTPLDLARVGGAPVVLVSRPGPDMIGHVTRALTALDEAATVATVLITDDDSVGSGEPPAQPDNQEAQAPTGQREPAPRPTAEEPAAETPVAEAPTAAKPQAGAPKEEKPTAEGPTGEEPAAQGPATAKPAVAESADDPYAALPLRPSGRIPAVVPEQAGQFAAAARGWLNPLLQAGAEVGAEQIRNATGRGRRLAGPAHTGQRVVLSLAVVFAVMVLLVIGLALLGGPAEDERAGSPHVGLEQIGGAPNYRISMPAAAYPTGWVPVAPQPRQAVPVEVVCPTWDRVTPTLVDPARGRRVDAAWRRIEVWLAAKAPVSSRSLRAGAKAADVVALQRRWGVALPADLVASLLRHDGVTDRGGFTLPFSYAPMSLAGIDRERRSMCASAARSHPEADWWDKAYVPFAVAADGGCLLADTRTDQGRVGEYFAENGTTFDDWPPSVAELLEGTAASLEWGRPYAGRFTPSVEEGRLVWNSR